MILEDANVQAAIVEKPSHKRAVQTAIQREGLEELKGLWVMEEGLDDLRSLADNGPHVDEMERRRSQASIDDVATIVYTSGTTGKPKGCMITHGNLVNLSLNVLASEIGTILPRGSKTIMFIPLAHIFARFISFQALAAGAKVGHTPEIKTWYQISNLTNPVLYWLSRGYLKRSITQHSLTPKRAAKAKSCRRS